MRPLLSQPDGAVLPYPKPLSVIVDGTNDKHGTARQARHGLAQLPAPANPRLHRLVLLTRDIETRVPILKQLATTDPRPCTDIEHLSLELIAL